MYTQFFGSYLLSNGYVNKKQLINALKRQEEETLKVRTLALHAGYITAHELEDILAIQRVTGKKFSEVVIEQGYVTQEQLLELINGKHPHFLALGQLLVEDGVFSYSTFEKILLDYNSHSEYIELEFNEDNVDSIRQMIDNFSVVAETAIPDFGKSYLELLFRNLARNIGDDYSTLPPSPCTEVATEICVSQMIQGGYEVNTYLNMDESTALAFAERYAGDTFTDIDEYVTASIEDVLNMHNGLFIVNASNDSLNELTISVLEHHTNKILNFRNPAFMFPICYPFGIIYFIMEVVKL